MMCEVEQSGTIGWLKANVPGFDAITNAEITLATDFLLLWSVFELRSLSGSASVQRIMDFAKDTLDLQRVNKATIEDAALYFRNRYFRDGELTPAFSHRYTRNDPGKASVQRFLASIDGSDEGNALPVFLIVYRLKNNLVHGTKMAHGLSGQRQNFSHANAVLKAALEATN